MQNSPFPIAPTLWVRTIPGPMPEKRYKTIVIGAGIIGTSIAYHLAKRGATGIAVLEKEINPGMGSTAKAAGGIRAQFGSEINIELSRHSIPAFEAFPEEMGIDVDFFQVGYLWLATQESEMELFRKNVALQQAHGIKSRLLTPDEIAKMAPYIRTEDIIGGTFHDRDGYAPPADYVMGYHKKSKAGGVDYHLGCTITGFDGNRVETTQGTFEAETVVCTAGAWMGKIGAMLDLSIPVEPIRRQCFVTGPIPNGLEHPIPMTIDFTSGIYMHSESGGVLVGKADKMEPSSFNEHVDYPFVEHMAELAMERTPILEEATIQTSWGGLYGVTPDHHPILGALPQRPGYYIAAGFSGHGFMHAPATGLVMAELLLDGHASTIDIDLLRFDRFGKNNLIKETHVI